MALTPRSITTSRGFKDISLSFIRHPVTNDVVTLRNEDAIKRSVVNLVRTNIGERFFNHLLGTSLDGSLFEIQTPEVAYSIQSEIETLLSNFEPRIITEEVIVSFPFDSNEMSVMIRYSIVGQSAPAQEIDFLLQPTRI
jgi:phage baseplate assembly protein W